MAQTSKPKYELNTKIWIWVSSETTNGIMFSRSSSCFDLTYCLLVPIYLEVILELGEEAAVDADHHVHGALGHHRHQAWDAPQLGEGQLGVVLDHVDRVVEEGLGSVGKDGGESPLDQRVRPDDPLGHAEKTLAHLVVEHLMGGERESE